MTRLCGLIMKGLDLCAIVVVLKKDSWTFLPSNNYFSFLMSYNFLSTFKDFFYSPANDSIQHTTLLCNKRVCYSFVTMAIFSL